MRPCNTVLYKGAILLTLMLSIGLTSCSLAGNTPAGTAKQKLDTTIQQARNEGVPSTLLQPVVSSEANVDNEQSQSKQVNDYNALTTQTQSIISQATDDAKTQASQSIEAANTALAARQADGYLNLERFTSQIAQLQNGFQTSTTPKAYASIQTQAKQINSSLDEMVTTYKDFSLLRSATSQMDGQHLNTGNADQEIKADSQAFDNATTVQDFISLKQVIDAQVQELAATQMQAGYILTLTKLNSFQGLVNQAKQSGIDTSSYAAVSTDVMKSLTTASSPDDYSKISANLDSKMDDLSSQIDKQQATNDLNTLQNLINYGNQQKLLVYEYQMDHDDVQAQINSASSVSDIQQADDTLNTDITNIRAFYANATDSTPYNQPHNSDLNLINSYKFSGKVAVVSLNEQTIRLYNNGHLDMAFYVVTGRPELGTPAGVWHIFYKETNIQFKSDESPNSPFWFPPTPINYAMEFRSDGYFIHDATWRRQFGPGSNVPHADYSSGIYSDDGSHGCINVSLYDTRQVFNWVEIGTPVIIY